MPNAGAAEARGAKPPISAYIRTRNEARLIARVVEAARRVADDVVIVDSGSTDETAALAEAAGARVAHRDWAGSGRQKRLAEDLCRNDWLLDLDADEIVSDALAAEIAALFVGGEPTHSIYRTPMAFAPPVGKPWIGFGGQIRHKLYDRRVVRQPDHDAWDQFKVPKGVRVGRLRHPILHYAFRDAAHLVEKVNRNSSTRARLLKPKPTPVLIARIFFGLPFYIAKRYILDGLFRGGVYGFAFSVISGHGRWLKDVKMYERIAREKASNQS